MSQKQYSDPPAQGQEFEFDLRYLWEVGRRRWRIVAAAATLAAAATAIAVFSMRPVYEATAVLLIEKTGANPLETDTVTVESLQEDYYQTQYAILKSRTLAEEVVRDLKLDRTEEFRGDDPVEKLRGRLEVSPVRRTRLVNVSAASHDPKMAADIANALAARYIERNVMDRQFISRDLLKALDGRAKSAHESLPAVVNSPLIQQLKGRLADLEGSWAELSGRYRSAHPRMKQLRAHIREVRAQIDREVGHVVESVKLQLSGDLKGSSVRVVDPALAPVRPARPRKARLIFIAVFLGLAVGSVLAVAVDRMDLTVRTQEDMEQFLKVPCLGSIEPLSASAGDAANRYAAIWDDARSSAGEAFRNLRTQVSLRMSSMGESKVVLVTSAVMEEGKSFVAANLARAFSQAGERVILVDADLRRPTVHRSFGLDNGAGLSGYLSNGRTAGPESVASGVPGLEILPCGPIPPNPAELLAGSRIGELLGRMSAKFDRVVVDGPPVFPLTDALLLARQAGAVVFVVNAGRTRATVVQRAIRRMRDSFATVLGGVLNRASGDSTDYYRYYAEYRSSPEEKGISGKVGTPSEN